MQTMVAQKPDLIILTPLSKAGLSAPVQRAMDAGIPVVLCGSGVTTDKYVTEGGRDLYSIAYSSAKKLAEMLSGKGNATMLNGISGTDTAITWHDAATKAFSEYPASRSSLTSTQTGQSRWPRPRLPRSSREPEHHGVWTGGSENAIGAIQAFADAGKAMPVFGTTNPLNGFLRLAKQYT